MMIDSVEKLMIQARTNLVLSQPFFGSLALRLQIKARDDIQTLSVDGKTLSYNPAYVQSLSFAQLVGAIAHEVMHCACGHHARIGGRDMQIFNEAADYAINPLITAAGMELPGGCLVDPSFAGQAAEEIYSTLRRRRPPSKPQNDDGKEERPGGGFDGNVGNCGCFTEGRDNAGKKLSEAEMTKQQQEWHIATGQAMAVAKRAGSMPGHLVEMFEDLRAGRVNWREALKRFVTSTAKQDYSWLPPNRRHIAAGLYLPSLHNNSVGEMVFAIDTSASMDTEALQSALDELNSILGDVEPERVHVLHADTMVHEHQIFEAADFPITLEAKGRGGTSFVATFEHVAAQDINPACMIYFSDMQNYDFPEDPGYPVLWASTDMSDYWNDRVPFGEIIKITAD
jgi:predicted metal-dependent peptidase